MVVPNRVLVHAPVEATEAIGRGDTVVVMGQVAPLHRFWNDDLGDPRPREARLAVVASVNADDVHVTEHATGIRRGIDRWRARIRERIAATFPSDVAPMARALVIGEDDLEPSDQEAFRRSGLAHLLAVSGMHLVVVVMSVVSALCVLFTKIPWLTARVVPMRIASVVGIALAWFYADLAGGSGSAVRAAWMMSAALAAWVMHRKPASTRAFGLSLCAMAACDPLVAWDLSFALSAVATAGLLMSTVPIAQATKRLGVPRWAQALIGALGASVAASVACAPLIASMAPALPLAGIVANLAAGPLGEIVALPLCLIHCVMGAVPNGERACAIVAAGALRVVRAIAHVSVKPALGMLPVPPPTYGQMAALCICLASRFRSVTLRPKAWLVGGLAAVGLCEWHARSEGAPRGIVRATFLDVGQGDSAIVDLPDGTAMVIDAGGLMGNATDVGARVLAPVLRARRRSSLRAVVLSHPHPDHFGGMVEGLRATAVAEFWDTGQGQHEHVSGGYAVMLARMRDQNAIIRRPRDLCGVHAIGGARIEVLAPCPAPVEGRGANDNSLVIRIAYGKRSLLFTGDAEHVEESDLMHRDSSALQADVLKVGHHGSRTSTSPEFVARVRPSYAVISCGVRNRFGHPAPVTLETLNSTQVHVLRIDREGAVRVTTDGARLDVRTVRDDAS